MSLIDLEDVAHVAAIVLSESGHSGATYELAGPEVLTPNQVAAAFNSHLGKDVRAEQIAIETWRRNVEKSGLGQYQVNTLTKMFEYYNRCGLWGNSRILKDLLGRAPTTFPEFVKRIFRERPS
jgi:nucleoside-diphosphate-sugar epimerase